MGKTPETSLRKEYQMRMNVKGRKSIIVTMPYVVVEREARKHNLEVDEFLKLFQAIATFNSFEGIHYSFERNVDVNREMSGMQKKETS